MEIQNIFEKLDATENKPVLSADKIYLHHVIMNMWSVKDIDFDRIDVADAYSYAEDFEDCVGREDDTGMVHFMPGSLIGNVIATTTFMDKLSSKPVTPRKIRHFI